MVLLCAYGLMNVRMMLLSKIGTQYDPATATGTVGRNYCYQTNSAARMFFEGKHFNPFIGAGTLGQTMDDFNGDAFDHSKLDFVGGAGINCVVSNGRPIGNRPTVPGSPRWGAKWKQATVDGYQNAMGFTSQGSSYPVRENYLDLDPTYKDRHGRPLLRVTFDFPDNDIAMSHYISDQMEKITKPFNRQIRRGVADQKGLGFGALSEHPQYRRGDHGQRSQDQRGEQVSAELGRAQCLCDRRVRLRAQCRPQSHRHGGGAGLLGGRSHHHQIHQVPRRAGARMTHLIGRSGCRLRSVFSAAAFPLLPSRCRDARSAGKYQVVAGRLRRLSRQGPGRRRGAA